MRRFVLVAAAATVFAVVIGPDGPLGGFWAPAPDMPQPHGVVLVGLIGEGMVEKAAFGVGIAVLLLGRDWFAARTRTARHRHIAWLTTVWLFASWMPHAALHRHIGMNPSGTLPVEWIFHAGSIVALALLLATLGAPSSSDDLVVDDRRSG
jgi:hypothetical protein